MAVIRKKTPWNLECLLWVDLGNCCGTLSPVGLSNQGWNNCRLIPGMPSVNTETSLMSSFQNCRQVLKTEFAFIVVASAFVTRLRKVAMQLKDLPTVWATLCVSLWEVRKRSTVFHWQRELWGACGECHVPVVSRFLSLCEECWGFVCMRFFSGVGTLFERVICLWGGGELKGAGMIF